MKTEVLPIKCDKSSPTRRNFKVYVAENGFMNYEDALTELLTLPHKVAQLEEELQRRKDSIHVL